jgi:phosphatidylglycerophosphatase A
VNPVPESPPGTTRVALWVSTGLGTGYAPFAPGTFGSLLGLVVWALLPASTAALGIAILVVIAAGTWSATVAERHFRSTDPSPVVIDEVLGMLITLFLNPVGWLGAGAAFFLFRLFDVLKPYPANRLERLHGGFGIMADDFMAAVYANIVLRVVLSFA